jgi:hypothetical protein
LVQTEDVKAQRLNNGQAIYDTYSTSNPPNPPEPTVTKKMPLWMMIKRR